jgi:hypothetical protein
MYLTTGAAGAAATARAAATASGVVGPESTFFRAKSILESIKALKHFPMAVL